MASGSAMAVAIILDFRKNSFIAFLKEESIIEKSVQRKTCQKVTKNFISGL